MCGSKNLSTKRYLNMSAFDLAKSVEKYPELFTQQAKTSSQYFYSGILDIERLYFQLKSIFNSDII